jgi:hypothetical protein
MRYLFSVIITIALLACHSKQKEEKQKEKPVIAIPVITKDPVVSFSFLDSIAQKSDLSIQQIQAHTTIDSFYYTGYYSNAAFQGDTVFHLKYGNTGVIINYDDWKNCSKKLFLVFPASAIINSDFKQVETDCDRDYSSDYHSTRYKLLSDSSFETIEYYVPANKEEDDEGSVWERIKYRINQKGLIDTLRIKEYHK